ncbi:hypothetical protein E4U55_003280 [Claviceps digitariae]|nr:hypothetical protein E4U55_003280 [Claviceps digitariae]
MQFNSLLISIFLASAASAAAVARDGHFVQRDTPVDPLTPCQVTCGKRIMDCVQHSDLSTPQKVDEAYEKCNGPYKVCSEGCDRK